MLCFEQKCCPALDRDFYVPGTRVFFCFVCNKVKPGYGPVVAENLTGEAVK